MVDATFLEKTMYSRNNHMYLDDIPREGLCIKVFATNEESKHLEQSLCVNKFIVLQAEVTIRSVETIGQYFDIWDTLRAQFFQHFVATPNC